MRSEIGMACLAGLCLLVLSGCGAGVEIPQRDEFDVAVRVYLEQKTMQLAIVDYLEFELADTGRSASATISLRYSGEGVAPVKVRFRFQFEKTANGWRVASHRKR